MDRQEIYNKTMEILKKFPDSEKKYQESALFHQVVQMLVRLDDPYLVIDQLINITEDTQRAFEQYLLKDPKPFLFNHNGK